MDIIRYFLPVDFVSTQEDHLARVDVKTFETQQLGRMEGGLLALFESADRRSDIFFCWRAHTGSMESVAVKNPKILGGTPVFRVTRVPLQLLFDSLERGHTLEEFLGGYPTVARETAIAALEEAQRLLSTKA